MTNWSKFIHKDTTLAWFKISCKKQKQTYICVIFIKKLQCKKKELIGKGSNRWLKKRVLSVKLEF